jgi:hypothetical protein
MATTSGTRPKSTAMAGYTSPIRKRCEYQLCGKMFDAKTSRTRFCCDAHRVANWRDPNGAPSAVSAGTVWHCEAPRCGQAYTPRSAHQHYCSDQCRHRAKYARSRGQELMPRAKAAGKVPA